MFMFHHSKGQSSMEMLLVTVAVISISIYILGNYLDLNDSTFAIAMLKADSVQKLNDLNSYYVIRKIDFVQAPVMGSSRFDGNFNIITAPATLGYIDLSDAGNRIKDRTKINPIIFVNNNKVYPYP
ncbi:MAG: hypothetical protein AB1467_00490 [Candidatus Diapherotrites archaeon]